MDPSHLAADPPIDDDSYQYEEQTFPSPSQKHVLYAEYSISVWVSRVFDFLAPLILALTYSTNFVPVTVYALGIIAVVPRLEAYGRSLVLRVSRIKLTRVTIFLHRITIVLVCALFLTIPFLDKKIKNPTEAYVAHGTLIVIVVLAICVQRAATTTQLWSLETDWARIMSNEQTPLYNSLVTNMHRINAASQLASPVIAGIALQVFDIDQVLQMTVFVVLLAMLIEVSLIHSLYTTCFALYLPRSANQQPRPERLYFGPTATRILVFIQRRPRPVIAALGMVFAKTTILTVGPQIAFFLLKQEIPIMFVAILPTLHIVLSFIPGTYVELIITALVATLACYLNFTLNNYKWFAFYILLSRVPLFLLDHEIQNFTAELIKDKEILRPFRIVENWTAHTFEIMIQFLTIIWSDPKDFWVSAVVSVTMTLIGLFLVQLAWWWPIKWGRD